MVKVFLLKSRGKVLAEVRTDGRSFELFNDATNGMASTLAGSDFSKLKRVVQRSSYLSLVPRKEGTPGILRYRLDNGDVVEMTTDGVTATLNGEILAQPEKDALLREIAYGRLTVVDKQDASVPTPINESIARPVAHVEDDSKHDRYRSFGEAFATARSEYNKGSVHNDPSIDRMKMPGIEWPSKVKAMVRYLRYGKFNG